MAEGITTVDAMLSGLHDIRLPEVAPGGIISEILVAVAFGLLLAYLTSLVLGYFLRGPAKDVGSLTDQIAALAGLPHDDRAVALLHLIQIHAPAAVPTELYARAGIPPIDELEAMLLKSETQNA
ncbi:hypothetical protein [Yoonia maritima]|uniref:hypothetical protein n=1 Tax=Yoonia maritima TaxID=1435347 RepID=UPI0037364512